MGGTGPFPHQLDGWDTLTNIELYEHVKDNLPRKGEGEAPLLDAEYDSEPQWVFMANTPIDPLYLRFLSSNDGDGINSAGKGGL